MKIEKTVAQNTMTFILEGKLDSVTSPELSEMVYAADYSELSSVVFDFEKLEYISSAGLRVILATRKILGHKGEVLIKNPNSEVKEILDVTGFCDIVKIV